MRQTLQCVGSINDTCTLVDEACRLCKCSMLQSGGLGACIPQENLVLSSLNAEIILVLQSIVLVEPIFIA